jgi:spermidine synthase
VAAVPDSEHALRLYRYPDRDVITVLGRGELMSSRRHGSEAALAELACTGLGHAAPARVLVGGLGLGYTLAAALAVTGERTEVLVSELVPEVVEWNRTLLGHHAGHPLDDPRTTVALGDIAGLLRAPGDGFDAILLDVDNGPEGLIRRDNDWLYGAEGLAAARRALRPGGVLAVWSATPDPVFSRRLHAAGFRVEDQRPRAHGRRGARHQIWLAR